MNSTANNQDDGSLAFLNIQLEGKQKQFNCKQTTQSELADKTFWIIDFIPDIQVKKKDEVGSRHLIKIKFDLNDPEEESRKFFTGSEQVKIIVNKIADLGALPRRVTLKRAGMGFFLN